MYDKSLQTALRLSVRPNRSSGAIRERRASGVRIE